MKKTGPSGLEFFGDFIDSISEFDPLTGEIFRPLSKVAIYPSSHYVTSQDNLKRAIEDIGVELEARLQLLGTRRETARSAAAGTTHAVRP